MSRRTASVADARRPVTASPARAVERDSPSIRGHISGPIPISSSIDDESFAENSSVKGPIVGAPPPPDSLPPLADDSSGIAPDQTPPQASHRRVQIAQGAHSSTQGDSDADTFRNSTRHRRDQSSSVRASTFSVDSSAGGKEKAQKKKSILRGALGKLFNRKKKSMSQVPSITENSRQTPDSSAPQKMSDSPAPIHGDVTRPLERERPASVPLSELNRTKEPDSDPLNQTHVVRIVRNSHHGVTNFSRVRLGSMPLHTWDSRIGEPTGLTPRPASSHGRLSKGQTHAVGHPEDTDPRGNSKDLKRYKRRSRSLSALFDASHPPEEMRTLGGEIQHWRESYDSVDASRVSSSHVGTVNNHVEPVREPETRPEVLPEVMPEVLPEPPRAETPESPVRMFDMPSMQEYSGMRITQVADREAKMLGMEKKIDRLETMVSDLLRNQGQPPAHRNKSNRVSWRSPNRTPYKQGVAQNGHRPRDRSGSHSSSSSLSSTYGHATTTSTSRPVSTATIRGAASLPSLSKESNKPFTIDHYTTLMALLETERSARLALETTVRTLGHQVNFLTRAVETSRGLNMGSKPSLGSAFDHDDDDDDDNRKLSVSGYHKYGGDSISSSRLATNSELASVGTAYDDDGDSNSYATPYEGDDADSREGPRKTDRTMSLSQLTMKLPAGRGAHDPMPGHWTGMP